MVSLFRAKGIDDSGISAKAVAPKGEAFVIETSGLGEANVATLRGVKANLEKITAFHEHGATGSFANQIRMEVDPNGNPTAIIIRLGQKCGNCSIGAKAQQGTVNVIHEQAGKGVMDIEDFGVPVRVEVNGKVVTPSPAP